MASILLVNLICYGKHNWHSWQISFAREKRVKRHKSRDREIKKQDENDEMVVKGRNVARIKKSYQFQLFPSEQFFVATQIVYGAGLKNSSSSD